MDVTAARCPVCQAETAHDVLKRRGRERRVRCRDCDRVHHDVLPRRIPVPLNLSEGEDTRREQIELPEDETIAVGDRLLVSGSVAEVTAVETPDGRRPDRLAASEIEAIWAQDASEIAVDVTVHRGRASTSHRLELGPGEQLTVGDVVTVQGERVRIERIKTDDGVARAPGDEVPSRNVVRVYARTERA